MTADDLGLVERWLGEQHVARWWLVDVTAEHELEELRQRISGAGGQRTRMLMVVEHSRGSCAEGMAIGWCQWYPYHCYPEEAAAVGARPGEVGIDYAIGEPSATGRGLGTKLIAALIAEVRQHHPGCG